MNWVLYNTNLNFIKLIHGVTITIVCCSHITALHVLQNFNNICLSLFSNAFTSSTSFLIYSHFCFLLDRLHQPVYHIRSKITFSPLALPHHWWVQRRNGQCFNSSPFSFKLHASVDPTPTETTLLLDQSLAWSQLDKQCLTGLFYRLTRQVLSKHPCSFILHFSTKRDCIV